MAIHHIKNYGIPTSPKFPEGPGRSDQTFAWYLLEDYEDGRSLANEHFFGQDYVKGTTPRYRLWNGGGGIGHANEEDMAIAALLVSAREELKRSIRTAEQKLEVMRRSLNVLNDKGLKPFEVPSDWTPARANGKQAY